MAFIAVLVSAVFPIALIALIGLWAGRAFALDLRTLARLNIYVLIPALVIMGLSGSRIEARSAAGIVGGYAICSGLLYLIAAVSGRLLKLSADERKSLIATTLFANTGNIGLSFILFTLGQAGLTRAVVYLVASSILIASLGPIVLKGEGIRVGIRFTLRLPVFWATGAGLAIQVLAIQIPTALSRGIETLGDAAIPMALLTLGIQLSQTQIAFGSYELFAASLRLFLAPLLAYLVSHALGLSGLDLQILVMQGAMPVAVNALIWVSELGGDAPRVARTIVLSTLMSFFTLPLMLWLSTH
ncbi:AEC family transporter [Vasconcelosia minhoensis]|uniref:AEC family transporter n=1 Tax=Vasconcelosia minhoensis TaxID=3366354 RepID=UPI001D14C942|nr:AEC family transporter [Romeria gracilis]